MPYAKEEPSRSFEENLIKCLLSDHNSKSDCYQLDDTKLDAETIELLEFGVFVVAAAMTSHFLHREDAMQLLKHKTPAYRLARFVSDIYGEAEIIVLLIGKARFEKILGIVENWIKAYRKTKSFRAARDLCLIGGAKFPGGYPK